MIIKTNSDTKQITIPVKVNKHLSCSDNIYLSINDICCNHSEKEDMRIVKDQRTGCLRWVPCKCCDCEGFLTYKAIDHTDDGYYYFLVDRNFWQLCCKKYQACLTLDNRIIAKFIIDKCDDYDVGGLEVYDSKSCCKEAC